MYRKYFAALFIAAVCIAPSLRAQKSFWESKDAYLAQSRPSDTPRVFAPGLLADPGTIVMDRIAISADGKEIYYEQKADWSSSSHGSIKAVKFDGHKWNGPTVLHADFYGPTFSIDGTTLYFFGRKSNQVWLSHRSGDGWSAPALFLDKPYDLYELMPTKSGTFYMGSNPDEDDKKRGVTSAYSTLTISGSNATAKSLGSPLNEPGFNGDFYVAPDESYIIVSANETKDFESDLYISFRQSDGKWSKPVSLSPKINDGPAHRFGQYVTPDGKYLFYTHATSEKDCTIYWVRFDTLLERLKPKQTAYAKAK